MWTVQSQISDTTPFSVLSCLVVGLQLTLNNFSDYLILRLVGNLLSTNTLVILWRLSGLILMCAAWYSTCEVEDVRLDSREWIIIGDIESCSCLLILLWVVHENLDFRTFDGTVIWSSFHPDILWTFTSSVVVKTRHFWGLELLYFWHNSHCLIEISRFSILTLFGSMLRLTNFVLIRCILLLCVSLRLLWLQGLSFGECFGVGGIVVPKWLGLILYMFHIGIYWTL